MKKKFVCLFMSLLLFANFTGCQKEDETKIIQLKRGDWAPDVKKGLNDFFSRYAHTENAYVVFDFDNTCSIFDIEEQLMVYQLQTMSFAMTSEALETALTAGLQNDTPLFAEWIADIMAAYDALYQNYGPFTASGLSETQQSSLQADPMWREFATKMACLYGRVETYKGSAFAYTWILNWFAGMTETQVYELAYRSHQKYATVPTAVYTWHGPTDVTSVVGPVDYEWTCGIQVTENIKELWKACKENGIDVWVCSASGMQQVLAAIDVFGLHDYCKGVLAMTMALDENGRYLPQYDYNATGYLASPRGWSHDQRSTQALTAGEGKVEAISNVLLPRYGGYGPLAGFMDSTGDFNFCTEFSSLKLVVCFNRANRKVTDGGGLVAEVAMYQKDNIHLTTLNKASEAGETLYLLQGRDENGLRSFRPSNATLRYGYAAEKLFANEDNYAQLNYMIQNNMTVQSIFDMFSIKVETSPLGFSYGFLASYAGYHNIQVLSSEGNVW